MAITIDSAPDNIHLTKGQMVFALSTDNTDATHILVNVLIELVFGSGTFSQVFSLDLPVDDDGAVTFHLEERIRAYLSFKLPDPNGAFVQAIDGPLKRYKIEYAELTADDMEFVQAVYHNDRSGSYPYVEEVALDEAMEVGVKYITISETDNPALLDDMEYTDGTNTVSPGTVEAFPRKQKQVMDVVTAYAYDAILLPANVTVRIYANALAYTVSGVYHSLLGAFSNKQFAIVPDPPANLAAVASSSSEINLTWDDVASADQYKVYRSDAEDGTYTLIATKGSKDYDDDDLDTNTEYFYKVTALISGVESELSASVNATTYALLTLTTTFDPDTDGNFAPIIKGDDETDIGVIWTFESTQVIVGNSPDATNAECGLDGTEQDVQVEFPSNQVTIFYLLKTSSTGFNISGAIDVSMLLNLKELQVGYNSGINSITLPANGNNVITKIEAQYTSITNLDLSNVNYSTRIKLDYCGALTGITTTTNINTITEFTARNSGLTTLDLSNWIIDGIINLLVCNDLTSIDFGLNTTLDSFDISYSDVTELDFSDCTFNSGIDIYSLYDNLLTSITFPTFNGSIYQIYFAGASSLTSIDFSPLAGSSVTYRINVGLADITGTLDLSDFVNVKELIAEDCTDLTAITYPSGSIGTGRFDARNTSIGSIPIGTDLLSTNIDVSKCGLTEAEVDAVISTLLSNVYNNGTLLIGNSGSGSSSNSAPSATGITNINTLASTNGWTITYWNGSSNVVVT